jgi:hypothetical protein
LVRTRPRVRSAQVAPLRSTSPIGRGGRFRICAVAVRIRRGAPIRPCSPTGRGGGFKYRAIAVRICARTPPCLRSPIGRGPALNAAQCRFEAGRGHHLTRLAQRQSISFTRRGSGSRNSQRVPIERYGHHDHTFDIILACTPVERSSRDRRNAPSMGCYCADRLTARCARSGHARPVTPMSSISGPSSPA